MDYSFDVDPDMEYEHFLETRYQDEADEELRAWSDEWPNGYGVCNAVTGCQRGIYHTGRHVFEPTMATIIDRTRLAAIYG